MRIFVLGKRGGIVHWPEDCIAGLRAAGHEVSFGVTRHPGLNRSIERLLLARWAGAPLATRLAGAIRRFEPDLILAIAPYHMPLAILRHVASLAGRPPLIGWVGDVFAAASACAAGLFDAVGYTDSGLLAAHRQFGWATPSLYLPHAANPRLDHGIGDPASRSQDMVFVATPTPDRRALVERVRTPMQLFGAGWAKSPPAHHTVHARQVGIDELASIYRSHLCALNIRNEDNVRDGLNQRHFDPYLSATPVVSDDQPDLARCFEPGAEILVYRDADELNVLYVRLRREPEIAARIGDMGRRRVMAEHTYERRLATLLSAA